MKSKIHFMASPYSFFFGFLFVLAQVQCTDQAAIPPEEPVAEADTLLRESSTLLDTVPGPVADWKNLFHPRYLTGRFTAEEHPDIVAVPPELTDGDGTYHLHREALAAFTTMRDSAARDSVNIFIVSAFRNFDRQKTIWSAKWSGARPLEGREKADEVYPEPATRALAILRYSSMPGSSRHHWGTDIDLNRLNNTYFDTPEGAKIYEWLQKNAGHFGFCQPYTPLGSDRPHGYQEERWHWSYAPLSGPLTRFAASHLDYSLISGFPGSEVAEEIKVIPRYVLGVNQDCRQ